MFFKGEVHLLEHLRSSWHVALSPGPPIFFSFCDGSRRAFFWFRVYANWRTTKWGRPGNEATRMGANSYWTMGSNLMLHNCSAWINTAQSSQIISLYWSRAPLPFCLPGQTLVPFTWQMFPDLPLPFCILHMYKMTKLDGGKAWNKVSSSSLPSYKTTVS